MTPDLRPEAGLEADEFQSILRIDNVTIETDYTRHFFKTILPYNITQLPLVTLEPEDPNGSFQAVISVFDKNGLLANQPLEQFANSRRAVHCRLRLTANRSPISAAASFGSSSTQLMHSWAMGSIRCE